MGEFIKIWVMTRGYEIKIITLDCFEEQCGKTPFCVSFVLHEMIAEMQICVGGLKPYLRQDLLYANLPSEP